MNLPLHKELDDLSFTIDRCETSKNGARIVWSWKFTGERRRRRSGNIAFASEREAGSGECVMREIVMPTNWETEFCESNLVLIQNYAINCFAEILSKGEKDCFVGLPGHKSHQRITDEEYEQLSYSRRVLREHGEFETLFAMVLESYEELRIALIGEIAEQAMFFHKRRRNISDVESIARDMRRFSRLAIPFLSLFRMYWHKLESDEPDKIPFYPENTAIRTKITEVTKEIDTSITTDIRYIASGLANLSLHAKPPMDIWHSNRSRNADIRRQWQKTEIYFGYLHDSRTEKLHHDTKEILESKESDNIIKHIDDGMFALQTIHLTIRADIQEHIERARGVIMNAIDKYVAEFDVSKEDEPANNFTLYKHWKGLENQYCEEEYIGMSWDKVTEELAGDHNKLQNISEIEIINPRDQQIFHNYIFVLAGRIPDRSQLERDIQDRGGTVRKSLSSKTTILIAGDDTTNHKISEASRLKKVIIKLEAFKSLMDVSNVYYNQFSDNTQYTTPSKYIESLFYKFGLNDMLESGIYVQEETQKGQSNKRNSSL